MELLKRRLQVKADFCEETVSLQVVGTEEEAIARFEKMFPEVKGWYRGEKPDVWDYDAMLETHRGNMERHWVGDGHKVILGPYIPPLW